MNTRQVTTRRRIVGAAAAISLAAGSLVAIAPVATAAPGDTTTFATGPGATGIAEDANGNLWVANSGGNSVSKVTLDGTNITYASAVAGPREIALGSNGSMWFTSSAAQIGTISSQGAVQGFPIANEAADIALGPDGNMWFTLPSAKQVGKITPTGAVTTYSTGNEAFNYITPGPQNSNRMYMASVVSGNLGIVQMNGTVGTITGPPNSTSNNFLQLINDQVWFIPVRANGAATLTRLINDSSFAQIVDAALPNPYFIGTGLDGTMWVADFNNTISHVTTAGAVVATYGTGGPISRALQAQDGNVWATAGSGVNRILTGVVPTSITEPSVASSAALNAGIVASATNGTWKYRPTSYAYQWQVCATANATSCADIPGATGQNYTVATTDVNKYLRVGVRATNLNGQSQPAYSSLAAAGAAPAPTPTPTPQPATGSSASIGDGLTMRLYIPKSQKRKTTKFYEVTFGADDVSGTVVFEFSRASRTVTKVVTTNAEGSGAAYRWKVPRKWRKGRTTVTATFTPSPGSTLIAAAVTGKVRIR